MSLSKSDLELRAQLWNTATDRIREFFRSRGYIEVVTPIVVKSPGMEPNLSPLAVDVHTDGPNAHSTRMGLITSPEYSMKKLLGGGMEKIFTLAPVFRDREMPGQRWSIEFTMLEWYHQGKDYRDLMAETGELMNAVLGRSDEWIRVSYVDEFEKVFGFVPHDGDRNRLVEVCTKFAVAEPTADEPVHEIIDRLFQAIIWPTIVPRERFMLCEYPVPCASLSKVSSDGRYAERFEAFVGELEMCNGFTELTDAAEQRRRFGLEAEERRLAKKEVFPIDEGLLAALPSLRSPTCGNALGVDRLVMLLAGANDIDSVHLFPPSSRY
ncbi:MAG: amino acid--tRNA ligase-related protein [Patescibacteria group bacterium]